MPRSPLSRPAAAARSGAWLAWAAAVCAARSLGLGSPRACWPPLAVRLRSVPASVAFAAQEGGGRWASALALRAARGGFWAPWWAAA